MGTRRQSTSLVDVTLTIPENQSWQSVMMNYIFSGRTDLAVGNFNTEFYFWTQLSPGIYEVKTGIQKTLPINQDYQVAAFVSGFSTTDSNFDISINQPYYIENDKTVGVIFGYDSNPHFTFVTFTYIVYPRTHPILKFDYSQSITSNLGSYYVSGPVNMIPNSITYNIWRILNRNIPCSGDACSGQTCILIDECNNRGGNFWQGQCYFCPEGIIF